MDSIDTSLDFINFVNDVALRHIEFEFKKPKHIEFNLGQGSSVEELIDEDNVKEVKEVENKKKLKHKLQKHFEKESKDLWLRHDCDKQIPYWDKNYWIHPDERCKPVIQKPVIKRRKGRGRRIREWVERRAYDAVAYVSKRDHHCHKGDSRKKISDCCGIKIISTAQQRCTVEEPHIHYTRYERIYHPAKTVHGTVNEHHQQFDTIIETGNTKTRTEEKEKQRQIYDFVQGVYHIVPVEVKPNAYDSTKGEKEEL